MSPVTKFEAIGIFVSVGIMAVALAILRFESDTFAGISDVETETQTASLVAANDEGAMREALTDNMSLDGTLTGLVIEDVRTGVGEIVQVGDTVTVHYVGTLRDGTQFDNSHIRGEAFTFTLGENKVIQGWEEGILGMQVGGERILVVPPSMAYGNRQVGPIPPNSPLVFAVELLSIE
jgi:FKBP-type peptidyl-prolyl cis-trans isomerase